MMNNLQSKIFYYNYFILIISTVFLYFLFEEIINSCIHLYFDLFY